MLTDEEKKVAYAWASWTAQAILDSLEEAEIERVDDEFFRDIIIEVLNDIAQANAIRGPRTTSAQVKGKSNG